MSHDTPNPPPDESGKVLPFKKPDASTEPGKETPSGPKGVNDQAVTHLFDGKLREEHRRLRTKLASFALSDEIAIKSGTDPAFFRAAYRDLLIADTQRATGHSRESVARHIDTRMVGEHAQADLPEETYVGLNKLSREDADKILEEAYAKALSLYCDRYPNASPTMFEDDVVKPKIRPSLKPARGGSVLSKLSSIWTSVFGKRK